MCVCGGGAVICCKLHFIQDISQCRPHDVVSTSKTLVLISSLCNVHEIQKFLSRHYAECFLITKDVGICLCMYMYIDVVCAYICICVFMSVLHMDLCESVCCVCKCM